MKVIFAIAAALLAAQTVDAQSDYLPFQNPGDKKCVLKGAFNKDNSYYVLKVGSCTDKNVANLRHMGKGKELRTSDMFCFDTITPTNKVDTELVLRKCPSSISAPGLKWTKVGRNQWQNGNKLCIEYNTKSKKFQQRKCATLADDDTTSKQQWVFLKKPVPPPAPPAQITCANWGKKWICADGWELDTTPGLTCVGATGASCSNVCCKKAAIKTCQNQGYQNACPPGSQFVNVQCGNKGQKACSTSVCCETIAPPVIKCNQWNRCANGYQLKPRASDIFCTQGKPVEGPNYAPTCSTDICCDPKPVPPPSINCAVWNEQYGQCDGGFQLKPQPSARKCDISGPNACNNRYCCEPSVIPPPPPVAPTCKAWTGKCDSGAGLVLINNPGDVTCSGPSCTPGECCVQDTCDAWSKRVVKKDPIDYTGYEVCFLGNDWAGIMDSSDPRFDQPCVDANGNTVVCSASYCCLPNA